MTRRRRGKPQPSFRSYRQAASQDRIDQLARRGTVAALYYRRRSLNGSVRILVIQTSRLESRMKKSWSSGTHDRRSDRQPNFGNLARKICW